MPEERTDASLLKSGLTRAVRGLRQGLQRVDEWLEPQVVPPIDAQTVEKEPEKTIAEAYGIESCNWDGHIERPSSRLPMLGSDALEKLVRDYDFDTVLDLGAGSGAHSQQLKKHGRQVTSLDITATPQFQPDIVGDYMTLEFEAPFDCVWCCHVLEHVPNVRAFLDKIHRDLREGGVLALTVPPAKHEVVAGHLTIWNPGLLLYNLVMAGFDCSGAAVKTYGYNVSVIVRKTSIREALGARPFDDLQPYFPVPSPTGFDGRITTVNW